MSSVSRALFGGSEQKSRSQQQSSSNLDPRLFNLFNQNFQRATGVANNLGARQFAEYTPDYYSGADTLRNTVLGRDGLNMVGSGAQLAQNVGQGNINPGSFTNMNISEYMNPYLQNVAGNTINDMYRARQIQGQNDNNAAIQARAFGGSRHGIAQAETDRNYYDRLSNALGNIYSSGFQSAADMANQDLNRSLQAQSSNEANKLSAANLLQSLGLTTQQMGLQGSEALMNLGLGEQQFTQQQLDAIRNLPLEQQALLNEALGINPAGGSGMTSKSSGSSSASGSSNNGIFKAMPFPL